MLRTVVRRRRLLVRPRAWGTNWGKVETLTWGCYLLVIRYDRWRGWIAVELLTRDVERRRLWPLPV